MEEETQELTPRQAMLLGLIIREHVETAAPVASRALVERYHLNLSTATVRNEMARLEELGYLYQPHTSAGRVPTVQAFRYFVRWLVQEEALSPTEQRRIYHQFHQLASSVDEWLPLAATVLARSTRSAALVTAPHLHQARYKHLELIVTHGRAVLLVLVLQGGAVQQQMLVLPESVPQSVLSEIASRFNQRFVGLNAQQIRERLHEEPPFERSLIELILSLMQQAQAVSADEVYQHGLAQLLEEPEFANANPGLSTDVIRVLEERSLLQAVIADVLSPNIEVGGVQVLIGGEGRWDELRACSLILARYGLSNYATGALGVVGPIRMPYGRVISVVRFVADVLTELVQDAYQLDANTVSEPNSTPYREDKARLIHSLEKEVEDERASQA